MEEPQEITILNRKSCLDIIERDLNNKDIIMHSFKITRASSDLVGFMGEYYKLKVEIKEKNSENTRVLSYFLKCLPITNPVYRNECERKGFFVKESSIYRDILPNIQKYSEIPLYPKSYFTSKDVIVLEDFSMPEKCLRQMEEGQKYTLQHFHIFLQHLAKLHSASLAWELKEGVNIGEKFKNVLFEMQLTTKNEWYITGIKGIIYLAQIHPFFQYPAAQEFITSKLYKIFHNMEEYIKPSTKIQNVICHRDSWDRNIFWEYNSPEDIEPIACRIVDFQLMRYSPPAIDVLNFLYNNFSNAEERDRQLPQLLNYYYENLTKEMRRLELPENIITKMDFDEDCHTVILPILTLRAICVPLMALPSGWADRVRSTEPEVFDGYMNRDRREMFHRVAKIDANYMGTVQKTIQEIMEYMGYKAKEINEKYI